MPLGLAGGLGLRRSARSIGRKYRMLKAYIQARTKLADITDRLLRDEDGASLVEYSVLIGLITVATVVTIGLVGTWISGRWTALDAALP